MKIFYTSFPVLCSIHRAERINKLLLLTTESWGVLLLNVSTRNCMKNRETSQKLESGALHRSTSILSRRRKLGHKSQLPTTPKCTKYGHQTIGCDCWNLSRLRYRHQLCSENLSSRTRGKNWCQGKKILNNIRHFRNGKIRHCG
jgi:hypothetical protein